jgi:3-(3-hydroxy-phenyl)propionate hydroxylase
MKHQFVPYPFTSIPHVATLPALKAGVETERHPVVVVGGGPVGFATALGIANHGVPVVVIEADDSVCFGSRAICVSRRSLEIIERLGALDGFLAEGLPWTGGRSFYRDTEVLNFKMPQDENQKLPPMLNLAQYSIEQYLLDAVESKADLIDVRWQSKVTAIDARPDGVRLTIETPLGGYCLDADWVVAADGGRSFVREALGLPLHGDTYEGRYVIVDVVLDTQRPTERLAYFDPACNRGSTVLVHRQPGNVWRIDYQLRDGEDPEAAIRLENVAPRVQSLLDMMGETGAWQPIWTGIYKANALTLESYRHGRVMFAGDAAHLLPIFGVRGANSGIDDADNLAWKLAFVAKGLASDRLLDSYSTERVGAAFENLSHGRKSTEFMAPPSFAFDLMRTAVLGLAVEHPGLCSLINPRQSAAITYVDSPLNARGASDSSFSYGPVPGATLPECPLTLVTDSGEEVPSHLTDWLSAAFTALCFLEDALKLPSEVTAFAESMLEQQVPFKIVKIARNRPGRDARLRCTIHCRDDTGKLFPMYGAQPGTVYLVRPDGHVLGRWHKADTALLSDAMHRVLAA